MCYQSPRQPTRLYRAQPPTEFRSGIDAWIDVNTNVVHFNSAKYDLRVSDDLRVLKGLGTDALYLVK